MSDHLQISGEAREDVKLKRHRVFATNIIAEIEAAQTASQSSQEASTDLIGE